MNSSFPAADARAMHAHLAGAVDARGVNEPAGRRATACSLAGSGFRPLLCGQIAAPVADAVGIGLLFASIRSARRRRNEEVGRVAQVVAELAVAVWVLSQNRRVMKPS